MVVVRDVREPYLVVVLPYHPAVRDELLLLRRHVYQPHSKVQLLVPVLVDELRDGDHAAQDPVDCLPVEAAAADAQRRLAELVREQLRHHRGGAYGGGDEHGRVVARREDARLAEQALEEAPGGILGGGGLRCGSGIILRCGRISWSGRR